MARYTRVARWYDVLSAEPVYRAGRRLGVPALRLGPGMRVLVPGCGTGLGFRALAAAVGPTGLVVGTDRSPQMLARTGRRRGRPSWPEVVLVEADTLDLDEPTLGGRSGFDAVLFCYTLSLMPRWREAWRAALDLTRPGGRLVVVDMRRPIGAARPLTPLALLACHLGGADIDAHPWTALEEETDDVGSWSARGGHVQVRAGTRRPDPH